MTTRDGGIRTRFDELKPGDRIEVEYTVQTAGACQPVRNIGTVVRTERRCDGRSCGVGRGDAALSDVILLELCDGELAAVTVDDSTVLRRA